MERRSEPRLAADEPVIVTQLDQRRVHTGLITEIAGNSLTMRLPSAIAYGTPVKAEAWDLLMLGEVVRCEPAGDGFRLALTLRHSLRDLHALNKLNQGLLGKRTVPEESSRIHIMRV
jgi:hypothetical protein